jgi:hypothetical protein
MAGSTVPTAIGASASTTPTMHGVSLAVPTEAAEADARIGQLETTTAPSDHPSQAKLRAPSRAAETTSVNALMPLDVSVPPVPRTDGLYRAVPTEAVQADARMARAKP